MHVTTPRTAITPYRRRATRSRLVHLGVAWWLAVGVALFGLALGVWSITGGGGHAAVVTRPGPAGPIVESVSVGSPAWLDGVRPGMPAEERKPGDTVLTVWVNGKTHGVADTLTAPDPRPLAAGVLLLGLAAALRRVGLPGSALLATLTVVLAVLPLADRAGLPLAFAVLPLPLLTAGLAIDGWPRRYLFPLRIVVLAIALAVLAAAAMTASLDLDWRVIWWAPSLIAISLVLGSSVLRGSRELLRWRRLPPGQRTVPRLLSALVPAVRRGYLNGREEERDRFASEVHREFLPRIRAIRDLADAEREDGGGGDAAHELEVLESDLRQLMSERQTMVLRSAGLGPALETMVAGAAAFGVSCTLDVSGIDPDVRLPAGVERAVYAVATEAVSNAVRHAGATVIEVRVTGDVSRLELSVRDDGRGFDPKHSIRPRHLGLAEMQHWASDAGADLRIGSRPGSGTEIRFRWPA